MTSIGIREFRDKLSHYVRLVETTGEPITITDHGRPIAELVPPAPPSEYPDHIQLLIDQGIATPPRRPGASKEWRGTGINLPPGTAKELLDEIRGDR